jgi:hypothetical protein
MTTETLDILVVYTVQCTYPDDIVFHFSDLVYILSSESERFWIRTDPVRSDVKAEFISVVEITF